MNATATQTEPTNFTAVIYALAAALSPYIETLYANIRLPWTTRDHAATRVSRLCMELLALTARINPARLGQAFFAKPAAPLPPGNEPAPDPRKRESRKAGRRRRLSARQAAFRLATLLQELEEIAVGTVNLLPDEIRNLCAQARAIAGCEALPRYQCKYEKAMISAAAPRPDGGRPALPHETTDAPSVQQAHQPPPWRTLER